MPGVLRQPQGLRADHRGHQGLLFSEGLHRRCCWPAWNTWTTATSRPWATPPRASAAAAQDGAGGRHRGRRRRRRGPRHQRGGAPGQWPPRGEASSPSAPRRAKVLARPQAHGRHQPPHQRLQGERGRGDPAGPHGRVHRRHRAHQHRAVPAQQAGAVRSRWKNLPSLRQSAAGQERRRQDAPARLVVERVQQAQACCPRCARCGEHWLDLDLRHGRASSPLQTDRLRGWKPQILRPLQTIFSGAALARRW